MNYDERERPFFVSETSNGSAVAAIVFAALAIGFLFVPGALLLLVASLLALASGTLGAIKCSRDPRVGGLAMAMVGIIVGTLGVFGIALMLLAAALR